MRRGREAQEQRKKALQSKGQDGERSAPSCRRGPSGPTPTWCDSELDMPGARRGGLSHIASMRGMWEQADSMEAQLEEAVSSSLQAAVAAARTAGQSHGRSSTAHPVRASLFLRKCR